MIAKVLAVILAAGVVGIGAVAYHHHTGCCPLGCDNPPPVVTTTVEPTEVPPCCQTPTRASAFKPTASEGCCCEGEPTVKGEVLAIQPREVK
jgi:hypothetical protein